MSVQPAADWFYVTVFGPQADPCLQYLSKGRIVEVVGRLEINRQPHKTAVDENGQPVMMTYMDLIADRVTFHGAGDGQGPANGRPQPQAQAQAAPVAATVEDESMPF